MNAVLRWFSAGVLLLSASQLPAAVQAPYLGDMDRDDVLSIRDAVRLLRMGIGLQQATAEDVGVGDLYPMPGTEKRPLGDGRLTPNDAVEVMVRAMGISFMQAAPRMRLETLAGTGVAGYDDRPGVLSRFSSPAGIAVDAFGALYVADRNNHRIRKVELDGTVTTLAGSSAAGLADGLGEAAQFTQPTGIAVAPDGDIYVTDSHRLRRVSPNGDVVTVAGATPGFADGVGTAALFNDPRGLAIDSLGYIYVADFGNNRVRRVTPGGVVETLAGNNFQSILSRPTAVAVDQVGNVYVTDSGNHRIRRFSTDGVIVTLAGDVVPGFSDGTGVAAQFNVPQALAMDANGTLYIADTGNNRIRLILPNGEVQTLAGQSRAGFADGLGTAAQLNHPRGIAVDALGNLYVADEANNRIRRLVTAQ